MQAGENGGYFSNNLVNCGFFSQNKVEKICLISWGIFKKTIIPLELVDMR